MSKQIEALKLALEGLEKWHFDKDPRGAADYITAIRDALAEESSGTEQPKLSDYEPDGMHHNKPHKCKYPKCDYPCPDLPDCRDAEPPCKTGSQCTSKCEQCRYKYDCDKAEQPAQKIVEEYDPDSRTISVYPSEWKAQQQEPAGSVYRYGKDSSGKQWHGIRWTASGLDLPDGTLIYTSPQPAQQKPVAWRTKNATPPGGYVLFQQYPQAVAELGGEIEPLYISPQPSKPLTDEDIKIIWRDIDGSEGLLMRFARAIEAKLKEKNA